MTTIPPDNETSGVVDSRLGVVDCGSGKVDEVPLTIGMGSRPVSESLDEVSIVGIGSRPVSEGFMKTSMLLSEEAIVGDASDPDDSID